MKRKHKIAIATGILSLSMVTAMATGIVNPGTLFAVDPLSVKSGTLSSVTGDFTAIPLDKLIGFGGDTFLYQNNDIFLRSANVGEGPFAPANAASAVDAMDYDKSFAKQKASTYGVSLYNSLSTIEQSYLVNDGNGNYAFIPEISQVTNTRVSDGHLWTSTKGSVNGRIQFINGNNKIQNITRPIPEISPTHTCVNPSTKTEIDAYGKVVYQEVKQTSANAEAQKWRVSYAIRYKSNGQWSGIIVKDLTTQAQTGEYNYSVCEPVLGVNLGPIYDKCKVTSVVTIPALNAVTCSVTREVESAGYRPAIQLHNLDVSMLMDNSNNSPITTTSSVVKMVFNSNDLSLTVVPDSIPVDTDGNLKVGVGENIKVSYSSTNTTGASSNIMAIYKDENGNKVGYKNLGAAGTGDLNIPTSGLDSGELGLGNYTVELYNMVLNGESESNLTSAGAALSFETFYNLKTNEVALTGNKVQGSTDWYNEAGITLQANIAEPYASLANYIRVGTASKIDTAEWKQTSTVFAEDGIYEKVQELNEDGSPKVDKNGDPVYNYDNCLYVQVTDSLDTNTQRVSSKLRLDTIKIDTKVPYFPSGKNNEEKPIKIENIKDPDPAPAPASFFASVFSLDGSPAKDLEEEFGGGHIKLAPNAKDYAASDYNDDGTLKSDATALKDGIASYKLKAKVLDPVTGEVDATKPELDLTINTNEQKFKNEAVDPYFELKGEDAYWIELTAVDRAGRGKTLQRKLYMDDTVAAEPKVEVNSIEKLEDGTEKKTEYTSGVVTDENGNEVANWVGKDIQIDLSLTTDQLNEVKSGIDHYEYAAKKDIDTWLKADTSRKREDYDGWISLGRETNDKGEDIGPKTIFKTDDKISSMNDEYYFRAVSRANIAGKESSFVINMDKVKPDLEVKAEVYDASVNGGQGGYVDYSPGATAKQGIRLTVTPKGTVPVSGVKYYYRGVPEGWTPPDTSTPQTKALRSARAAGDRLPTDEEIPWIEIKQNEETKKYSILASDQFKGTYYFRAANGANVTTAEANVPSLNANVGVDQPTSQIKVEVVNSANEAYDGKWTNKDLTLTLTGGLDGSDTVKHYEYATDPDSTEWKKITADADGHFILKIDSSQTVNANYYFRVIKNQDPIEIPYSKTAKGVRIRHDAVAPLFKDEGVKLNPEAPDIATSYVTLSVEMTEVNADELANASPIAFYSVDGDANWIPADGKDSRKFTYDFKDNTSNIKIMVKDEAGNESTYATVLNINNIDKTGPSAPKFPSDLINGEWKNSEQKIPITFEPATTGAPEHIQYRVQKLDGDVYKEYDLTTNAFIDPAPDTVPWVDAPVNAVPGTDTVEVILSDEGSYKIIARTIDSKGRYSAEAKTTSVIRIDKTEPIVKDLKQVKDKWAAAATGFLRALTGDTYFKDHITYTFVGEDQGGSGLEKFQYQLVDKDASGAVAQPADDAWVDAYKGEVNIEKDFSGKLYIRSMDYAGNISQIVETTDMVHVDATEPELTITPEKLDGAFTNTDSVTITAKDGGSGIQNSEVAYETGYVGPESFPNGKVSLDTNGTAILNNLPDGEYNMTFKTLDNSGHQVAVDYPVRIDTEVPEIKIIDNNTSGVVKEKDVTIEVKNTISGQQDLNITLDGKEIIPTKTKQAPTELTDGDVTVYTAKVASNGKLEAEVVSNAIHNGANAKASDSINITNVFSVEPQVKVEAYIGKSEQNDKYEEGQWTSEHVEIVLTNTEDKIKTSDLTFQYKEYDRDGKEIGASGWKNTNVPNPSNVGGKFSVYKNGIHKYEFRAVMLDPADPNKDPIIVSEPVEITIMQDIQQPAAPKLVKAANDDYTPNKWYHASQKLEVDFTPNTDGAGQWIEYMDTKDTKPAWIKVTTPNANGKYEIKVTGDKQHVIRIRSNDSFGRFSAETDIAYVNIDTATPDFDVDIKYTSANATVNLVTKDKNGNSTIGVSGIADAQLVKLNDAGTADSPVLHFYGDATKRVLLDKDNYGNGTYKLTLITESGKTVSKDIVVDGISLPKPLITVNAKRVSADGSYGAAYTSGTWISGPEVELEVVVKNTDVAGTNITYQYQEDGDNDWTDFAAATNKTKVSGAGKHAINLRAMNASGAVSDVVHFNVWIDDTWDHTLSIDQAANYTANDWYNKTQTITSTFTKDADGCEEWVEYSEDNGASWTHNSRNTYVVSETGAHTILVRKNDAMNSAATDANPNVQTIYVNVDKEPIKNFEVRIDKDRYASFLSTITFGAYHKDVKKAAISGDFGVSGPGTLYYQIVSDPSEYVNAYESDTKDGTGWKVYTDEVQLDNNFKGYIYAKARDKAGNISNIIRTDGIVIDTVFPNIEILDNGGQWITQKNVEVEVSDFADAANSVVGNASGITSIDYDTIEPNPIEGTAEVENNTAVINNLRDGEYDLHVVGSDKAGNMTEITKTIKLDRTKPSLAIEGYNELSFSSANNLTLKPSVGASGVKSLKVEAALRDGTTINETEINGPDYRYSATQNGTYTFTLTNNADATIQEVLEVQNIANDLNDVMGLDVKTVNLNGDEIDYLNAEELPGSSAAPAWTSNSVVFRAHGNTKFKASVDNNRFTDFDPDGTFTVKNEGIHTVRIKNYENDTTRTFLVKIDTREVKDVKIIGANKLTPDRWINDKNFVVQATFTPEDTGIDEWLEYYDAGKSEWVRGDSVVLVEEGVHTVRFRGNDELNRPTAEQQVTVNVDKTAPTDLKIDIEKNSAKDFINHIFPNIFDSEASVTIHANSDISGNRKIEYQVIDEGKGDTFNEMIGWQTYNGSFTIPEGFKGKVYARAIDNAGNRTQIAVTEDGIIVDADTPQVMFQTSPMTAWSSENKVKATITPTLSGLQSAWYTITKNGIVTKHTIDLNDIDASNSITLNDLPNGKYTIELSARSKAGKTGTSNFEVMFENRAPLLSVDADLDKKATSVPVTVDVDMNGLYTTLDSLTWQTNGTSPQDILADKKFTIHNNGVYKIIATTSSGVTAEKTLVVTNITNVSSMIGFNAYYSEDHTKPYTGGDTWSDKDITIEARDIIGKVPAADLMMEMRVINLKDNSTTGWTVLDADKNDASLYKVVATDEGSYVYEFRGKYEGVAGATTSFQVNIDRSAPKKPLFADDTLKKYDNEKWHNEYDAELKANLDATDGCDEWLEYNIDGATDFDGNPLWLPTTDPKAGTIKVVDDKDHIVKIRTTDRLDRHSETNEIHVKLDNTRPTGFYIKEGENKYQDFLDKLTGGNFYKDSRTIEIGGNFKLSGVDKIEYQIVEKEADFDANGTWKKLNVASGDEHGTFQLLPGAKGIIYARGVDKAGNETGIIRSDLITIDNTTPLLIVPADDHDWSDKTEMKIKVKDDESGIQSVTYSSEDPAQSGDVMLSDNVDADGYREGTITNLKDGRYKVEIIVTNGAGMTQTEKPIVMIDTVTPDLKFEGQTSKPQTSTTLDLIPIVGGSGLQEIQVLDKNDDGTYTVIQTILPNADGSEKYPYEFIENGTYYFRVVNGNGIESDVKEISIGNIKSDKPVIVFRTDNGYDPKTWSGKPVMLEVNTNSNAKLYYRVKGATNWTEADKIYYQNLPFNKTGIYTYEFKSVVEGVGGASAIETTEEYTVKVDLEAPKKPSIQNLEDYNHWYQLNNDDPANLIGKIVTLVRDTSDYVNGVEITKYGDGSKETVYYNIEGKVDAQGNPEWIEIENDKVNITTIGDNLVTFKIIDEVTGHETFSDPVHVKIYQDDPTITLTDTTKPVKTYGLEIEIGGAISKDDQIKKLTIERVGSEPVDIQVEQGVRKYSYPISKNGTYNIHVEMEFGGSATKTLQVTNIIEEDPLLEITATSTKTNTDYDFGTWSTSAVKLKAKDPKSNANLKIKVRSKSQGGTWSTWSDYTGDIDVDTSGIYYYQFMTVLSQGSDKYETIMDETYAVKVDLTPPEEVTINEFDTYKDPNKWTSTSVNLTTTFTPKNDGAKEWVEYSLDDGTTWIKKNSVLISKEGQNKIIFRSTDEAGQITRAANKDTVYVNIDKTSAGSLSMTIAKDNAVTGNPNNITFEKFYKSSDTVTLTLLDDKGTAVTTGTIYYQFADGHNALKDDQWQTYSNPVALPAGFKGSIYAYAVNQSGKSTDVIRSNGITVDDDAPTIKTPSADMSDWDKSNSLAVEIEDEVSGINEATVSYKTYADASTTTEKGSGSIDLVDGKGTISSLPNGEYYIEITASDNAGNTVTSPRRKVMIDAEQYAFDLAEAVNGDHKTITATVTSDLTGLSGIEGIYIRSKGSSWALMGDVSPATYDVYKNGVYEVKVVNNAGKDSEIKQITISGITNDLPDFNLRTTDGFEFGDFWYQPLTIEVLSDDADAIYYSTSGKDGPWKNYKDKIEIDETSAYQYTFKIVKGDKELISMPYDVRVIIKQAEGTGPVVLSERNVRMFMRSVFRAFSEEEEKWHNTGTRITFTPSSSTAPGLKAGTFIQVLEADENGEGIGYNENNFTLVDEDNPEYIFNHDGRYVVYQFYAYYKEGEEDRPSKPSDITKTNYNIDGTNPESLKLTTEMDGTSTILNDLTGGLFFKEPIKIIPEGRDSLSGIDHYEFQSISCSGDECEVAQPINGAWETAPDYTVPQDFEGIVYVRAVDKAKNNIQKSVRLAIKDDVTTYKILEDISDWTNTKNLNIEVTPSTTGLQELNYKIFTDNENEATAVNIPATDTEKKLYTIHDIPEGEYNLKVIPVENGGTSFSKGVHELKVDRTKPVVQVEFKQSNDTEAAQLMNKLTMNAFYRPGLIVSATATDQAGTMEIDPTELKMEYSLNGGEWKTYSTPLTFDNEEVIDLSFRAIDQAGNISDIVTKDGIAVDATAPEIKGASNNVTYWLPRTITVQDNLSGVDVVKVNDTVASSTVLVKDKGLSRIEAVDRSGNENSLALTIKGLDDIKDDEINNELIQEIEKEFEDQKPGYDKELADEIQKQIDDLKDRNTEPSNPDDGNGNGGDHNNDQNGGNQGNGDNNGSDNNGGNGGGNGSSQDPQDPTNGGGNITDNGNRPTGNNGTGGSGNSTGTNGSGSGTTSSIDNPASNGSNASHTITTASNRTTGNFVNTGDVSNVALWLSLGICSLLLAIVLRIKKNRNA